MARLISDILGAREPGFTQELLRLEKLAGDAKVDIKLISELVKTWQELAVQLGFDGKDTTARELYFALQKKLLEENQAIAKTIGVKDSDSSEKMIKAVIEYLKGHIQSRPALALKTSVLKDQLKKNQPKKTLKILGLRSIDSAIKREPIAQLLVFARMLEGKGWQEQFTAQAASLKPADFDKRPIEISLLDGKKADRMHRSGQMLGHLIYRSEEAAGIVMVVPKERFSADLLYFIDALYREQQQIRHWSAFVRYLSVRPDFGRWLSAMRATGFEAVALQHFNFGWSPVHQYLHQRAKRGEPALFEPHLDHEDVQQLRYNLGPLWQCSYLLKNEKELVVSCNISDVILNAANNSAPEAATSTYGRRALYDELFARYLDHELVLEDFFNQ